MKKVSKIIKKLGYEPKLSTAELRFYNNPMPKHIRKIQKIIGKSVKIIPYPDNVLKIIGNRTKGLNKLKSYLEKEGDGEQLGIDLATFKYQLLKNGTKN